MNIKPTKQPTKLKTKFEPPTRFEITPAPVVPFRATERTRFERLEETLLEQLLHETATSALNAPIRRAANEAAALAWLTLYPLLVFPELLTEKVAGLRVRVVRQEWIRTRSERLLAEAV